MAVFVTGNQNKLREVKAILGPGVQLRSEAVDGMASQGVTLTNT